jgi:predicted small secreted protein
MLVKISGLFALVGLVAAVSACNTVEGAGKDVKATGQAIEDAAKGAKPKSY